MLQSLLMVIFQCSKISNCKRGSKMQYFKDQVAKGLNISPTNECIYIFDNVEDSEYGYKERHSLCNLFLKLPKILWMQLNLYSRLGVGKLHTGIQIWPLSVHCNYFRRQSLKICHGCSYPAGTDS